MVKLLGKNIFADVDKKRSLTMAAVKSKDTSCEIILRKALWAAGVRGWQLHRKEITGNPDLVFKGKKIAIFIDGCFWHGCETCCRMPKTRKEYWENKIKKNIIRDKEVNQQLKREGWKILRFWEHEIKREIDQCISRIINAIK